MFKRLILTAAILFTFVSQAWAIQVGRANAVWLTSDTVATNIDVNVGFTPTAGKWFALVYWSGASSATDAVGSNHILSGVSFATSGTSRRGRSIMSNDNGASSFTGYAMYDDAIIRLVRPDTKAIGGALDIVGEITNGLRFTVDQQMAAGAGLNNIRFQVFVIDDLTGVGIFNILEPAATGNTDHTGAGVDNGDLFFFISSTFEGTTPTNGSQARLAFGAAHADGQGIISVNSRDGQTDASTTHYCRDGEVIATTNVLGAPLVRASFVSAITDGVRLNWAERSTTNSIHFGAVLKGIEATIQPDTLTQTDTVTDINVTGLGNTAKGGLVLSCAQVESAADTAGTHHHLSIGSFTSTTNRGAHATWDENAAAVMETAVCVEYDAVYCHINASDTLEATMDVTSLNSNGATFRMTDADPTQRWFLPVLFADPPAPGGGGDFFYRRRAQ